MAGGSTKFDTKTAKGDMATRAEAIATKTPPTYTVTESAMSNKRGGGGGSRLEGVKRGLQTDRQTDYTGTSYTTLRESYAPRPPLPPAIISPLQSQQ